MRIIPAIDIMDGQCVRLSKGDFSDKTVYAKNPVNLAKTFEDAGVKYLHVVDLDGAKSSKIVNLKVLENITSQTNLIVDFGGGIKTDADISDVFSSGATRVNIGSLAVQDRDLFLSWVSRYGTDKIILGADVNNEKIAISGWKEKTSIEIIPFLQSYHEKGVYNIVCTDIQKDGMLSGSSIQLYEKILTFFPNIKLVASGGVVDTEEIDQLIGLGVDGIIIGKALYENKLTLKDLKQYVD